MKTTPQDSGFVEYPFYGATIARDGSIIVSKEQSVDFLISPETLYTTIETLLTRREIIESHQRFSNIVVIDPQAVIPNAA